MHHKRKRPKNRRSGCLYCKPYKVNGYTTERLGGEKFSDHVRRVEASEAVQLGTLWQAEKPLAKTRSLLLGQSPRNEPVLYHDDKRRVR